MAEDSIRHWPDPWVIETLREAGMLDVAGQAKLAASGQPTAWAACIAAEVATDAEIVSALSRRFGVPVADMSILEPSAGEWLTAEVARQLNVVPLRMVNRTLDVACCDPADPDLESAVAFATRRRIRLHLADPGTIATCLNQLYPGVDGVADAVELEPGEGILRELSGWSEGTTPPDVEPTQVVEALIVNGIRRGTSDVHLQPHETHLSVRYRLDGVLHEVARIPRALAAPITSRVKVLANLDIADRLRPQDGRAQVRLGGRQIDLRISTLPVGALGEKTVIRLLDSAVGNKTLALLGYEPDDLRRIEYLFRAHEGLVLVTGPTGSGKTTTLYAALRTVQTPGINIVTVEDPVEYRLPGIAQVQINERAGLTFSSALRSILRQDPDVVLVGEIRDRATADIALQASLTGHLVLSTLHTNDAPSTLMRLVDIGVDLGGLASALKGVIAQRLLRRLCPSCKVPRDIHELAGSQRRLLDDVEHDTLYVAGGCEECGGTGYRGRMVVSEIALVTTAIERAIMGGADAGEIADLCVAGGMRRFWEAGLARVASGDTSLNELLDNIYPPVPEPASSPGVGADDAAAGSAGDEPDAPASTGMAASGEAFDQADVDAIFGEANRAIASAGGQRSPSDGGTNRPPSVLLIDEDAQARQELRSGLEKAGFRVMEAADGEAGIEYARRIRPDFIVTELTLPKVDGFGVLRELGADDTLDTPILVLTSNEHESLASWALELGAHEVLAKPIEPRLLGSRLQGLIEAVA